MQQTVKKRLRAPERRARILKAAAELIAEHGYDRVSVGEIAEAAGCSKAVLYDHFASKGEVVVAIVEDANQQLLIRTAQAAAGASGQGERAKLEAAMNAFFEFVEENKAACRVLFRDPSADPVVFDAHTQAKQNATTGVAAMIAADARPAPGDTDFELMVELYGEILTSALAGMALWWERHPDVPREVMVRAITTYSWLGFERLGAGERLD